MIMRKSATVTELNAKQAILTLENGQELKCLRDDLEPGVAEGKLYVVQILPEEEAKLSEEALARTLLNQLLSDGDDQA